MKYFLVVTVETLSLIIFRLPRYRALNALKSLYLRAFGVRIGRRVFSLLWTEGYNWLQDADGLRALRPDRLGSRLPKN